MKGCNPLSFCGPFASASFWVSPASPVPLWSWRGLCNRRRFTKIVNDVRVVNPSNATVQTAKVRDLIKGDLAVRTGAQSRAELLFQDRTLTRLGAEALFSFKAGTRDMTLDRGTMLLQVPKGLGGVGSKPQPSPRRSPAPRS